MDLERYPMKKINEFISDHTLRLRGDVQMNLVLRWIKHDVNERHAKFKVRSIQMENRFEINWKVCQNERNLSRRSSHRFDSPT